MLIGPETESTSASCQNALLHTLIEAKLGKINTVQDHNRLYQHVVQIHMYGDTESNGHSNWKVNES